MSSSKKINNNKNEILIFDLVEKSIPSITRYRKYLVLLLKRLNTKYIIELNNEVYKKTIKYLEEIMSIRSGEDLKGEEMNTKNFNNDCNDYSDFMNILLKFLDRYKEFSSNFLEKDRIKTLFKEYKNYKGSNRKDIVEKKILSYLLKDFYLKDFYNELNLSSYTSYIEILERLEKNDLERIIDVIHNVISKKSLIIDKRKILCILFNPQYICSTFSEAFSNYCKNIGSSSIIVKRTESSFKKISEAIMKKICSISIDKISIDKKEKICADIKSAIEELEKNMIGCRSSTGNICSIPDIRIKNNLMIYPCLFIATPYSESEPNINIIYAEEDGKRILEVKLYGYTVIRWEG
ncbi:MAG: hypothetical protein QXL19_09295 [Ignisphaera sp.]